MPKYKSPEHSSWENMKSRCSGKSSSRNNRNYFMRGVKICERWKSFDLFLKDMGEKPAPKKHYSLDRIDNKGNYEPNNCRWATWKEQANNRSNNVSLGVKKLEKEQLKKKKGKHIDDFVCAQVLVPSKLYDAVRKKCDQEGFTMTTYWRKWILEGYNRDIKGY